MYSRSAIRKLISISLLSAGIFSSTGCSPDTASEQGNHDSKTALLETLQGEKNHVENEIERLKENAHALGKDAQDQVEQAIHELEQEKKNLSKTINKVKHATNHQWESVQRESKGLILQTEKTLKDLEKELRGLAD